MAKKELKNLIIGLLPGDRNPEERRTIKGNMLYHIGHSSLRSKIERNNSGVFYDSRDEKLLIEELSPFSNLGKKLYEANEKKGQNGLDAEEVITAYQEVLYPDKDRDEMGEAGREITCKEACKYLKNKYGIGISQEDLKKTLGVNRITKGTLKHAKRLKMFDLVSSVLATKTVREKYEITVTRRDTTPKTKIGIPKWHYKRTEVMAELKILEKNDLRLMVNAEDLEKVI